LVIGIRPFTHENPLTNRSSALLIENKYAAISAVLAFLIVLWLSDGSMIAAFGALALIAGIGWAVRRVLGPSSQNR
jgi:hypothetical protein